MHQLYICDNHQISGGHFHPHDVWMLRYIFRKVHMHYVEDERRLKSSGLPPELEVLI